MRVLFILPVFLLFLAGDSSAQIPLSNGLDPSPDTNQELFLRWRDVNALAAHQRQAINDPTILFAPINDGFSQAIPISGATNRIVSSTSGATREPGEPEHGSIVVPGQYGSETYSAGGRGSLWWGFVAPTNGMIELDSRGSSFQPIMVVYEGDVVTNLTEKASNFSFVSSGAVREWGLLTRVRCDVQAGKKYHIAIDGAVQGPFTLLVSFTPAPHNDDFASRFAIFSPVSTISGSNLGATLEANEPDSAGHSVWWTWTPPETGPYILTTIGSTFDTVLSVYRGTQLPTLTLLAGNDNGYAFAGESRSNPFQDFSSRLRFDAVAGVPCQISIASAKSGNCQMNVTTLAIEDIVSFQRTIQATGTTFTTALKISNLRQRTTGSLRLRLVGKARYQGSRLLSNDLDVIESLNTPDEELGSVSIPSPGYIAGSNSIIFTVTGVYPARSLGETITTYWNVYGVLEELAGGSWNVRDTRLIAPEFYRVLNESTGGGVVTLSANGGSLLPFGYFRIQLQPAATLSTNGGWRIVQLADTAYYRDSSTTYGLPAASGYTLEFMPAYGFATPPNQSLMVLANQTNTVTVTYTNILPVSLPPRLSNGVAPLAFSAAIGQRYAIERSTNLMSWVVLATNIVGGNGVLRVSDSNLTNGLQRAFYRARFVP